MIIILRKALYNALYKLFIRVYKQCGKNLKMSDELKLKNYINETIKESRLLYSIKKKIRKRRDKKK